MMIEIPENYVLAKQINRSLAGKTIVAAQANTFPHTYAMYSGDPANYEKLLNGKVITDATPGTRYTNAGATEILCEDMLLIITTPIRYHAPEEKTATKHQLLLSLDDGSRMSCTVQMWGSMFCYSATGTEIDFPENFRVPRVPDPYQDTFDETYFASLLSGCKPTYSVKAFLATEQRIPGLGNGVLQDILFNARIHPKHKIRDLSDEEFSVLFRSLKKTLGAMYEQGGRDTEKDLYGQNGGYRTILSQKTIHDPCPVCGGEIVRQAFLGGNIYFCANCQK